MPTARVLVTGASGFTGRYLCALLRNNGYSVVAVTNDLKTGADEVSCDLRNRGQVRELIGRVCPDFVVHLAALSFVDHDDAMAFYDVNVFGTLHIIEEIYSSRVPIKKIIVASSANIYGNPEVVGGISETTCPAPVNHYANSKLAMENMVKTWFDKLPIVIVRPFNYTGPGQDKKFLVPKIVDSFAMRRKRIELGNLNVSRDFSDVRDVVRAYLLILQSEVRSEIFNVCSGRAYELRQIVDWVSVIAGYETEVVVNPEFVRENEIAVLRGSNDKLHALLGYQPVFEFSETLKDMYTEFAHNVRIE